MAAYNARREREQQLLDQYNQEPVGIRNQNLWLHQVDRSVSHQITGRDIFWTCFGLFIVAIILLLSIWL